MGTDKQASTMRVTIMAGIPGSGKSHSANRRPGGIVLSTDDFWVDDDGEYEFDPNNLTQAHGWNFRRFLDILRNWGSVPNMKFFEDLGIPVPTVTHCPNHIIIDNTNTTIAEIAPYYAAAQAYGAEVEVLAVLCPWQVASARQTHDVPDAKVYQMSLRLEDTLRNFPSWWNLDVIHSQWSTRRVDMGRS